jgi:uncharacterized membrane protein
VAEGTQRIEAFSDGVFAIAITLLVLEIKVPHAESPEGLWTALAALWPSYVAFLLSFFVILIMWINHHELLRMVRAASYPFLFANGFLLLTVTFTPFPTAVLAEHLAVGDARVAVTFYCGTFIVNSLAWGAVFLTIIRDNLFRDDVGVDAIARVRRAYIVGPLVYIVATVLAYVHPWLGLGVNASLWILWARLCYQTVESEEDARARLRA